MKDGFITVHGNAEEKTGYNMLGGLLAVNGKITSMDKTAWKGLIYQGKERVWPKGWKYWKHKIWKKYGK